MEQISIKYVIHCRNWALNEIGLKDGNKKKTPTKTEIQEKKADNKHKSEKNHTEKFIIVCSSELDALSAAVYLI